MKRIAILILLLAAHTTLAGERQVLPWVELNYTGHPEYQRGLRGVVGFACLFDRMVVTTIPTNVKVVYGTVRELAPGVQIIPAIKTSAVRRVLRDADRDSSKLWHAVAREMERVAKICDSKIVVWDNEGLWGPVVKGEEPEPDWGQVTAAVQEHVAPVDLELWVYYNVTFAPHGGTRPWQERSVKATRAIAEALPEVVLIDSSYSTRPPWKGYQNVNRAAMEKCKRRMATITYWYSPDHPKRTNDYLPADLPALLRGAALEDDIILLYPGSTRSARRSVQWAQALGAARRSQRQGFIKAQAVLETTAPLPAIDEQGAAQKPRP